MADGEKRIKELEEITALTSNDYFVVDSSASGEKTKKYKSTYITDIINNIPELVAEFEPNHYYDRDALVAHEGKVYYHNAPGASYEEFPTGYQFIQIDLTGLLSRLGFGISIQHNSSFTYNKGDYCMEDYILYRCLNDNVTGAWSSSDWARASLGYDLSSIYKPRLDEHDEQIEESLALGTASGSIATFTDGSTLPMRKLEVAIEPQQDLHGYDNPWVGGSGKNKLPMTVDGIKALNTTGTWSGNSYTQTGVTFTIQTDADGNVIGIKANGNATADIVFMCGNYILKAGSSIKYSGSANGSSNTFWVVYHGYRKAPDGDGIADRTSASTDWDGNLEIHISNGVSLSNQMFYPMIRLATVSDETFAPYSNICPISGWDEVNVGVVGKNFLNTSGTDTNNGYVYGKSLNTGGVIGDNYNGFITEYSEVIPNKTHIISGISGINTCLCIYDENKTFIESIKYDSRSSFTFDVPSNGKYVRASVPNATASSCQINIGLIILPYEPYNPNSSTITIQLGDTYYGGTLDVVSGVLTVERASVDLGSLSWTYSSSNGRSLFTSNDITDYKHTGSNDIAVNAICECFAIVSMSSTFVNGQMGMDGDNVRNRTIICDNRYSNASDFKTAMNGVQLVYELATPTTIQLTPTQVSSLMGVNNIWADTGNVLNAEYVRDTTTIINQILARLDALEG